MYVLLHIYTIPIYNIVINLLFVSGISHRYLENAFSYSDTPKHSVKSSRKFNMTIYMALILNRVAGTLQTKIPVILTSSIIVNNDSCTMAFLISVYQSACCWGKITIRLSVFLGYRRYSYTYYINIHSPNKAHKKEKKTVPTFCFDCCNVYRTCYISHVSLDILV